MRQRVMIALALSCNPTVLIADEPTTALDVTIQAQILERMRELRDETGAAVILVTHDLGVVADIADRIAVMYAGRIVEQGTLDEIFYDPQHPYTWGLLGSITRVDRPRPERLPAIAGLPPSLPTAARAATSGRAARTSSPSARRCRRSRRAWTASRTHCDRCWLAPEEKREQARGAARRDRARRPSRRRDRVSETETRPPGRPTRRASSRSSTSRSSSRSRRAIIVDREVARVHAVNDVTFRSTRARRSGWSASRAAARRRCRGRSCA